MVRQVERYLEAERRLWDHLGVTPVERRVTLASGGQVRVQEVGEGPPFVLLHGGSIAGTSWATLAGALEGIRCVLVDRPGCGLSDPIVGGPLQDLRSVEAYATGSSASSSMPSGSRPRRSERPPTEASSPSAEPQQLPSG